MSQNDGSKIEFVFGGLQHAVDRETVQKSEGIVLRDGTILHIEWICGGAVEKLVHVGNVIPTIDVVDAARKMHFGLAEVTGFDPNFVPDLDALVIAGVLMRISL
jgi:hypothetical protein